MKFERRTAGGEQRRTVWLSLVEKKLNRCGKWESTYLKLPKDKRRKRKKF